MQGLTKRQREIVDYIEAYIEEYRHSPSYRDIQEHFGFSSLGTVYNHIQALKRKEAIQEGTQRARSLALQESGYEEVALIGKLRGGHPIETFSQFRTIPLPKEMTPNRGEHYLLQIVGQELQEELLTEGDLLLIEPRTQFVDGEMVIALIDGQTTLIKRGYDESPYLRLESTNPLVQPLLFQENSVEIQGVVLSLFRHYSSSS